MISKSEAEDNEVSMASNAANENVAGFKGHAASVAGIGDCRTYLLSDTGWPSASEMSREAISSSRSASLRKARATATSSPTLGMSGSAGRR